MVETRKQRSAYLEQRSAYKDEFYIGQEKSASKSSKSEQLTEAEHSYRKKKKGVPLWLYGIGFCIIVAGGAYAIIWLKNMASAA